MDTVTMDYDSYNELYADIGSYSDEQNNLYCQNKHGHKIFIKIE